MASRFKAIWLEKSDTGATQASVRELGDDDLRQHTDGNVVVRVEYSTLNYKDGLAITGKSPVVRKWPMVPGIDLAGVVESSEDPRFKRGDAVLLNGWGAGETSWGGLAGRARVKAEHLTARPATLGSRDAMAIGTAGYTAMLSAMALERHGVKPGDGDVLVTGANGGVGSFALAILAARGYRVVASTGRPEEAARLKALGASEVIERATLSEPGKPLQKERWAGAIDSVGSHTLANVCAQMRYGGVVTACGLAQGLDLPGSVAPFILRGVLLAGIDSVYARPELRESAWQRLAAELDAATIGSIVSGIGLAQSLETAPALLAGKVKGRVVVDVNG
ncbi:MAG: MDR family oxidoreductase [Burkholderiaceae bacterium]